MNDEATGWNSIIAEFLDYQRGLGRADSTIDSHQVNLQYWTRYLDTQAYQAEGMGIPDPTGITPQIVAGYQGYIYQYRTRFGRHFALQTQVGILNALQVFYKYLIKAGHTLNNPAATLTLPRQPKRLPGTILTPQEARKLLSQPDTGTVLGFRDRTMYEVLYSTGLRVGELTGMRVQDLHLPRRSPEAQALGTKTGLSEGTVFVPESKRSPERIVPVGETARRYLNEYLERIRPLLLPKSAIGNQQSKISVVFLSRSHRRLDLSGVQLKLRIYAERAGIEKHITPHVFRHTLATDMLRRGADMRQIQELLGHKHLRTTQVYTHIFKGELRRIQAHCHPREQTDLPDGFTAYRGRDYLTEEEIAKEKRLVRRSNGQTGAKAGNANRRKS